MRMTTDAWATILLTVPLKSPDGVRALTTAEWARLSAWLDDRNLWPSDLVNEHPAEILDGWADHKITADRLQQLLGREQVMGAWIKRWRDEGLVWLTPSDEDYPKRLRKQLEWTAPPVLFTTDNTVLLDQGGLAVVGSRNASEEDCAYATELGTRAASEGICILSGGARGIDQQAMLGALEAGGQAIAILPNNIVRTMTSASLRDFVDGGQLALVTPYNPDAGWNARLAMGRNKHIYCLSDAAVAVTSAAGQGGTWAGATENLRRGWVPLWVKDSRDHRSGSHGLVARGARFLPAAPFAVSGLTAKTAQAALRGDRQATMQF